MGREADRRGDAPGALSRAGWRALVDGADPTIRAVTASVPRSSLAGVPGVPETALEPQVVDRLPEVAPAAPWDLELQALVWFGRPAPAPARVLPSPLRANAPVLARGGGLVRYLDTPVGAHAEALGEEVLWHGGTVGAHVPFMAVDSPLSLVGGRTNWALPKTLASFEGDPVRDRAMTARGEAWEIRARATAIGPPLPYWVGFALLQVWPDGGVRRATGRMRGRARPALLTVEVSGGAELRRCVGAGSFLGAIVESAWGRLDAPV